MPIGAIVSETLHVQGHSTRSVSTLWVALQGFLFQASVQLHHGLQTAYLQDFIGLMWSLITQWQQPFFLLLHIFLKEQVGLLCDLIGISHPVA